MTDGKCQNLCPSSSVDAGSESISIREEKLRTLSSFNLCLSQTSQSIKSHTTRSYEHIRWCESVWFHCCQLSRFGQKPVYFGRLLAVLQNAFCHVIGFARSDSWSHQCPEMHSSWTISFRSQEWIVNCQFSSCMSLLAAHVCSGTSML